MAHSVSASQAPRLRTCTDVACSSSSNNPNRRAVWDRMEAPPKAVMLRSVKSSSTFGGRSRILRLFRTHLPGAFPRPRILPHHPCRRPLYNDLINRLSGYQGQGAVGICKSVHRCIG